MQRHRLTVSAEHVMFFNGKKNPDLIVEQDGYKVCYSEKHSTKECGDHEKRSFTLFCLFLNFCRINQMKESAHCIVGFDTTLQDLAKFTGMPIHQVIPTLFEMKELGLIEYKAIEGQINFEGVFEIIIGREGLKIAPHIYAMIDQKTVSLGICPEIQFYDISQVGELPDEANEKDQKNNEGARKGSQ